MNPSKLSINGHLMSKGIKHGTTIQKKSQTLDLNYRFYVLKPISTKSIPKVPGIALHVDLANNAQ